MHVGASGRTIEQYFNEVIGKEVIDSVHTLELVGAFLGRSKEQLDAVDTSVPLDMAVQSFGGFLRFSAASPQSIEEMWKELQSVDSTLTSGENVTKSTYTPDKACTERIPCSLLRSSASTCSR